MRIDYVQQHAGNTAVYMRKRQRPYAQKKQEKKREVAGGLPKNHAKMTKKQEKTWRF
jgi:hypothetical protein